MARKLEAIDFFVGQYGKGVTYAKMPKAHAVKVEDRVPPFLVARWKKEGLTHHADGFFWWVDPVEYEAVLASAVPALKHAAVVMRTGLGALVIFDERKTLGEKVAIFDPLDARLTPTTSSLSVVLNGWFTDEVIRADLTRYPLYLAALPTLGPPGPDEVYAPKRKGARTPPTAGALVKKPLSALYGR